MIATTPLTIGLAVPPCPPFDGICRAVDLADSLSLEVCSTWDHLVEFAVAPQPGERSPAHVSGPFEYQTVLGAIAMRARSVRLAIGVTELLRRHPVVVAQALITLAHLARRRPILGIGAGERSNTEPYGLAVGAPVSRLEEGLQIIRDCLDERTPLTFHGRYFAIRQGSFELRPPNDRVPSLWVGGRGPRMRGLAGRFGDGWYPADILDPTTYAEGWAGVCRSAGVAGRDPNQITPALELAVFVASQETDIPDVLESDEARLTGLMLGADAWAEAGLEHPLGAHHRGFVDLDPVTVTREALNAVPASLVERHVLSGPPSRIADQVAALYEAGLRHINFSFGAIDATTAGSVRDVVRAVRTRLGGR